MKRSFVDGQMRMKAGHPEGGQVIRCRFCAALCRGSGAP